MPENHFEESKKKEGNTSLQDFMTILYRKFCENTFLKK